MGTYTLPEAYDVNKTIIIPLISWGNDDNAYYIAYYELSDSTTVRIRRRAGDFHYGYFNFQVVEFGSGIKSIQKGVTGTSGSDIDITIDPVDPSKCWPISAGSFESYSSGMEVINSTTLRIIKQTSNIDTFSWQLVEFE